MDTFGCTLSVIEEEVDGLSLTGERFTGKHKKQSNNTLEMFHGNRANEIESFIPQMTGSSDNVQKDASIRTIQTTYAVPEVTKSCEVATKYIKEKYDSLGRLRRNFSNAPSLPSAELDNETSLPLPPPPSLEVLRADYSGQLQTQSAESMPFGYQQSSGVRKTFHGQLQTVPTNTLTEEEILQVDLFYRGHKSQVSMSSTIVSLYFGNSTKLSASIHEPLYCSEESCDDASSTITIGGTEWQPVKSGVLVVVLDNSESKSRRRKLTILLAERGTGFALWKDTIDHLTEYRASSERANFHVMHLSNDHSKEAGFSFENVLAANEFLRSYQQIISENELLLNLCEVDTKRSKKKSKSGWSLLKKEKTKLKLPKKQDISSPCCFTHVTQLDRSKFSGNLSPNPNVANQSLKKEAEANVKLATVKAPLDSRTPNSNES